MFSADSFNWRGFAVGLADAVEVPDVRTVGARVYFDNGRRFVAVGVAQVPALPAAWLSAALGAAGYIGPVSAALALARGGVAVFDAGGLLIDGLRLIGPAGKVFAFSSASSADMWASINRVRVLREWELIDGLSGDSRAAAVARKAAALAGVAAAVVNAAGRCSDAQRAAALVAESNFISSKWEGA